MFSLEVESDSDSKDLLVAELWEAGSTGIVESELAEGRCLLRAFFEPAAAADSLQQRFGGRIENHPERDWVELSREGWAPRAVGSRFYLVPEWMDDAAPAGRFRISINPGLACGTGFHEATELCLEALESYVRPGMTVLDVGAGSGILSIAAALLGAERVVACDTDPVATQIASRAGVRVFTGSAAAIRSSSCDLALANINAPAAVELAAELRRCLKPGGRLVASGFEAGEAAAVEGAYGEIERMVSKGDWRAVIVRKPD